MNKQELIEEWSSKTRTPEPILIRESFNYADPVLGIYEQGFLDARTEILRDLEQLDEPQKRIMPKFFDDWAKQVIERRDKFYAISLITRAGWGYGVDYELDENKSPSITGELLNWLVESPLYLNKEKAVNALLYGYEVEKEPLYYIKLPSTYNTFLVESDDGDLIVWQNTGRGTPFTEKRIKAIDERYWAFAVKVEEVLEG